MEKIAVIIGAGQTGRGFIAPILVKNNYKIIFLDENSGLIEQLNNEKKYSINYFGETKPTCVMDEFLAFNINSVEATNWLSKAELVFTSVYASNLSNLIQPLNQAINQIENKRTKMNIVCCENGINVKKPLIEADVQANISEGIIFCTTLRPDSKSLDLLCEDYPEIPIDGAVEGLNANVNGMPIEMNFPSLIQRKIYTYNFMSAIVSYLGAYLKYENYGLAANNPIISDVMNKILPIISDVIAEKYKISFEEQWMFTKRAISKFQNIEIIDTIQRNSVNADRKLKTNERILGPLSFACEQEKATQEIELICTAAIYYGIKNEGLVKTDIYQRIVELCKDESIVDRIDCCLKDFMNEEPLDKIIQNHVH